jgi:hypothetical protein
VSERTWGFKSPLRHHLQLHHLSAAGTPRVPGRLRETRPEPPIHIYVSQRPSGLCLHVLGVGSRSAHDDDEEAVG